MVINRENFANRRDNFKRLYNAAYADARTGLFDAPEIAKLVFEFKYLLDEACEIVKSQDKVIATQDKKINVNEAKLEKQTAEISKLKAENTDLKAQKKGKRKSVMV